MEYSIPLPGSSLWTRKGAVSGWDRYRGMYGIDPREGVGCAQVSSLAEVRSVCSTWRALLSSWLLQPMGLISGGGRALPQGCLRT
jgi:hypothetical protein